MLTCFEKFDMKTFRDRFIQYHTDLKRGQYVDQIVSQSQCAKRTIWYDEFQKMTNKIEP